MTAPASASRRSWHVCRPDSRASSAATSSCDGEHRRRCGGYGTAWRMSRWIRSNLPCATPLRSASTRPESATSQSWMSMVLISIPRRCSLCSSTGTAIRMSRPRWSFSRRLMSPFRSVDSRSPRRASRSIWHGGTSFITRFTFSMRARECALASRDPSWDRSVSHRPFAANGIGSAAPVPQVWADAVLDYVDNKLEATLCVTIPADRTDARRISGCTVAFLYTADPDRVIDGVFGTLDSQMAAGGSRPFDKRTIAGQGGPVRRWSFSGFGPGREGVEVGVTARLKPVRIVSTEGGGCVGPIAYMETKRTTVLDPATRRALDAQSKSVDPAILGLRPRFAPRQARPQE